MKGGRWSAEVWTQRDLAATQLYYHEKKSHSQHPQDHERDQAGFCSDVPTNMRISECVCERERVDQIVFSANRI